MSAICGSAINSSQVSVRSSSTNPNILKLHTFRSILGVGPCVRTGNLSVNVLPRRRLPPFPVLGDLLDLAELPQHGDVLCSVDRGGFSYPGIILVGLAECKAQLAVPHLHRYSEGRVATVNASAQEAPGHHRPGADQVLWRSTRAPRPGPPGWDWGELFVLFGANGSGKTTLIRSLATLARFDSGLIQIAGRDLRANAVSLRRSIGVLTHQTFLYDDLTAHENLRFYGRMFRVPELEARIRNVADQMGLQRLLHKRVRTLSHGMQKRLSLVRAVLHDPPYSPPGRARDRPRPGGPRPPRPGFWPGGQGRDGAVVMTTHNLDRGLALGDRVAILADGRIAYPAVWGSFGYGRLPQRLRPLSV